MSMMASGSSSAARRQGVGQHQAPLGVGVEDLDAGAVAGDEHVAGVDGGTARHVLGGRHPADDPHRQLELGGGDGGRDHRGRARPCRSSWSSSRRAVFRDSPPESKVMPLPTRATVGPGCAGCRPPRAWAGRTRPARIRGAAGGGLGGAGGHPEQAAEALGRDAVLVPHVHLDAAPGGHLGRHPRQLGRGEVAGRAVDPVPGPPGGVHRDLTLPHGVRLGVDDDHRARSAADPFVGLLLAGAAETVGAEPDALDRGGTSTGARRPRRVVATSLALPAWRARAAPARRRASASTDPRSPRRGRPRSSRHRPAGPGPGPACPRSAAGPGTTGRPRRRLRVGRTGRRTRARRARECRRGPRGRLRSGGRHGATSDLRGWKGYAGRAGGFGAGAGGFGAGAGGWGRRFWPGRPGRRSWPGRPGRPCGTAATRRAPASGPSSRPGRTGG